MAQGGRVTCCAVSRSAEPPANRRILRAVLLGAVGLGGAIIVAPTLTASRATPSASALSSVTVATTAPVQTASAIAVSPVPLVVYYARDGLPPFRALALGGVRAMSSAVSAHGR